MISSRARRSTASANSRLRERSNIDPKKERAMEVQPYLFFDGRCEEAIDFYKKAAGADVTMLMRYKECPEPVPSDMVPKGSENKVMHASFRIGDSVVMAS